MAKDKPKSFTTPLGIAFWARLITPDFTFAKERGRYSVKLRLGADEAQPLIDLIDEAIAANLEASREAVVEAIRTKTPKASQKVLDAALDKMVLNDPPYAAVCDEETGEETGEYDFNFGTTASYPDPRNPDLMKAVQTNLFDAKGKRLEGKARPSDIWNGSKIKCSYSLNPYTGNGTGTGVSLRLNAVQIVELVNGGTRSASDYGFGDEGDGYTGEDVRDDEVFGGAAQETDGEIADY